jgi:hypothetical protein
VRTLFSLEQRWTPYADRLGPQLATLAGQGWPDDYLHETLLALVRTADPERQLDLAARAEALLRSRGFGSIVDVWTGELDRLRAASG